MECLTIKPDVEAIFEFNRSKTRTVRSGYRPAHMIDDKHLTSGEHHYYEVDSVAPGESAKGTISFISPESYPRSLWIGKRIAIQEGSRIVGYATITKIYNQILWRRQGDG